MNYLDNMTLKNVNNMNNWYHITWLVFHVITFHTVLNKPTYYYNFFYSFTKLIPCSKCRNHYKINIENPNDSMNQNLTNLNIFNWMVDIHNDVNKVHNMKIWSYKEAFELYKNKELTKQDIIHFLDFYILYNKKNSNDLVKMIIAMIHILPENILFNTYKDFIDKNPLHENNISEWFISFKKI